MVDFGKIAEDALGSLATEGISRAGEYAAARYIKSPDPTPTRMNDGGSTAASQQRTPYQATVPPGSGWAGVAPNQQPQPSSPWKPILIVSAVVLGGVLLLGIGVAVLRR